MRPAPGSPLQRTAFAEASDLDSANRVLTLFVADYNRRFARRPRQAETAWRPAPQNLERICCFTHERIVSNDNVVQWEGRRLQIHPQPRRYSFAGAKVQIHQAPDGRVSLYYRDTRLEHSVVPGVTFHVTMSLTLLRCYVRIAIPAVRPDYAFSPRLRFMMEG